MFGQALVTALAACVALAQGQILTTQPKNFLIPGTITLQRTSQTVGTVSLPTDYTIGFNLTTGPETPAQIAANPNWRNILHVTATGNNCCNHGDRVPSLFFQPRSRILNLMDPGNGNGNNNCIAASSNPYYQLQPSTTYPIQIDYFTTMIRLIVNGTVLCQEARTSRPAYSTVYVYAANPWYDAASGSISGLYFQATPVAAEYTSFDFVGPTPVQLAPNTNLGAISIPYDYEINFAIMPGTVVVNNWANVLHFTATGDNCCDYGDRIPAIWFRANSRQLYMIDGHSQLPTSGNDDLCGATPQLPDNAWTQVRLVMNGTNAVAYINGTVFCTEARGDRRSWPGTQVWMADPWYPAANAMIANFTIIDNTAPNVTTTLSPGVQSNTALITAVQAAQSQLISQMSSMMDQMAVLNASIDVRISDQVATLSNQQSAAMTAMSTTQATAQTNAINAFSTLQSNAVSTSMATLTAQQSTLQSNIRAAVSGLAALSPPSGQQGQPQVSLSSTNDFRIDGAGRSIKLAGDCGVVDPCQVAQALNSLRQV